jgi:hypothetical protein
MSHKTSIELKLNNQNYLCKALDRLGFKYSVGQLTTKGSYVRTPVDILLEGEVNGKVGFKKKANGNFSAVGDFHMGARTPDGRVLTEQLLQQEVTAVSKEEEAVDRLVEMGFEVQDGSRVQENGKIKLSLERWTS